MNELQTSYNGTANLYAVLRDTSTGDAWNGSALATYADGSWSTYAIPLASLGGDLYAADMPAALPAGNYRAFYYVRAGGSPATSDVLRNSEAFRWNGSTTSTTPIGTPSSIYADATDLDDWFGVENIDAYSDLSNTDTRDNARIQKFLDKRVKKINRKFKLVGRPVPIASDDDDFEDVKDATAEWVGAMLAKGRGDLPAGVSNRDEFDKEMDGHIERADALLQELIDDWLEANPDLDTEPTIAMQAIVPSWEQGCGYPWGWM